MSDPIFDISSWYAPDQQQEVDPWAAHNDLTPSVQQGYSQLLPTLLKKVLEDDDSDLGMYTPQGYFIPRGKASREKRAAQRAQALEMMKGLMGQLNESTLMGGSGRGRSNGGLLGGIEKGTPGMEFGKWTTDPATGEPRWQNLHTIATVPKVAEGQIFDSTGNRIADARPTPEWTAAQSTAKSGPDYIIKKSEKIQEEETRHYTNFMESQQIAKALDNPAVAQYFGPGGSTKMTVAGLARTMFPSDAPDQALAKAQETLGRMYSEGLKAISGLSPVTDPDLKIALDSIAGDQSVSPEGLKALARATMKRSRINYKRLEQEREGLRAYPSQDPSIHKVNPRIEELPPEEMQPVQGMQPVPVQRVPGAQAPAKPMSAAEWAMKTGRLSAPRLQPQSMVPGTQGGPEYIPNAEAGGTLPPVPIPNVPDNQQRPPMELL
jgi:hypothetical protein